MNDLTGEAEGPGSNQKRKQARLALGRGRKLNEECDGFGDFWPPVTRTGRCPWWGLRGEE